MRNHLIQVQGHTKRHRDLLTLLWSGLLELCVGTPIYIQNMIAMPFIPSAFGDLHGQWIHALMGLFSRESTCFFISRHAHCEIDDSVTICAAM